MSKEYAQIPSAITDNCDVIPVWNYSASSIPAGSSLIVDTTNNDTTKAVLAVAISAAASGLRTGIAKSTIPAAVTDAQGNVTPGIGSMVTGGICRALAGSAAFTAGNRVLGAAGGLVVEGTTAGQLYGTVLKTETTTTPLILVALS